MNRFAQTSTRAGRYELQSSGYSAFMPHPLPPSDPPISIDQELQQLLSRADRALGRLDGAVSALPDPDWFVLMYVKNEAVLSSQIEGTQSSLHDVLAAEAQVHNPHQPADVSEVINYIRAMNYGLKRLATLPVSTRLIREIHEELLSGTRGGNLTPGQLRASQNWIGPGGCTLATATFVPPPQGALQDLLSDLELFLHSDDPLPILIRIGLAHSQFETIHPFLDGNGHVGRLLITFLLTEARVLSRPVLYLSHHFKQNRQEYYDRLQAVRMRGEWEAWLRFFLEGVEAVSEQATLTVRRILQLQQTDRTKIMTHFGRAAGNAQRLHDHLFTHPVVTVKKAQELNDTSYQAANQLVSRFCEHGILQEYTGNARNRSFIYRSYTSLFG